MSRPDLGIPERTPPPARGGCRHAPVMALLLFLGAIGALGGVVFLYLRQQQDQARAEFAPPTVLVTAPVPGTVASAGSYLSVSATAFGSRPIARAELWMDGKLKETQKSVRPEGDSTFYAHFDLLISSEGPHFLSVRAVNAVGIIGKSLPVGVLGTPKPGSGEVSYAVRVNPGETLADIAKSYGSDPATLQKANPDLGGQEPAAGVAINVPVPPKKGEEAPAPEPPPPVPGSTPVQTPNVPMLTVIEFSPLDSLRFADLFTSPAPPDAPTDLQGEVVYGSATRKPIGLSSYLQQGQTVGCDVMLQWNDNATNELRYEVWTAWMGITPRLVASLNPSPTKGPAWYKFRAPQTGWIPFWVEAVNSNGNQPSNTITLFIDPQKCSWTTGSGLYLMVQVFEMTVKGNYDKVYCYVSHEGNPERRIPENAGDFIQVKTGKADFGGTTVGQEGKIFAKLVPIPQDGSLDVEGRCLGWSGATLNDLGSFAGKYTVNEWDGARRSLKSATYEIEFAVKPWTPAVEWATMGKYWYEDPTLPAPYNLTEENVRAPGLTKVDPRERYLHWKWDGDPKRITGFQVYLGGIPYAYFKGADTRSALVQNPFYCGHRVRWEVASVADLAQSPRSAALEIDLAKCQTYAMVKFEEIYFSWTSDGLFGGDCDTLDGYYSIRVNNTLKSFWGGCSFGVGCFLKPIKCGKYTFAELGSGSVDPNPDTIVVPINTDDINLEIITWFKDQDDVGPDDTFGVFNERYWAPSLQKAREDLGCGKSFVTQKAHTNDTAISRYLRYAVTVFPNECSDFPLGIPLPVPPWPK